MKGRAVVAVAFVISLVVPLIFFVGPLRLSAYRATLVVLFLPVLVMFISGKAGRMRMPDLLLILMLIWSTISFVVVHGLQPMVEPIGIMWIEVLGAYLVGRVFVRSADAFHAVVRTLFLLSVVFLPFLLYENSSGRDLVVQFFGRIGTSFQEVLTQPQYRRLGFDRAQGPFAHPIHNGVFFGSLIGVSYFVLGYGKPLLTRLLLILVPGFAGTTALSSGPLAAITSQINLLVWDGLFKRVKRHWLVLIGLFAVAFVVVDMISNRTPFHVFASYLALNNATAYGRIMIWHWGVQNIFAHPLFGLGLNDWVRAPWMTASVDMFWIVGAMRHGLIVWATLLGFFFWILLSVAFRNLESDRLRSYRTGYVVTLMGFFLTGWAVHFWDALYAYFIFMLGAGVWFLDVDETSGAESAGPVPEAEEKRRTAYSRFQPRAHPNRASGGQDDA